MDLKQHKFRTFFLWHKDDDSNNDNDDYDEVMIVMIMLIPFMLW